MYTVVGTRRVCLLHAQGDEAWLMDVLTGEGWRATVPDPACMAGIQAGPDGVEIDLEYVEGEESAVVHSVYQLAPGGVEAWCRWAGKRSDWDIKRIEEERHDD